MFLDKTPNDELNCSCPRGDRIYGMLDDGVPHRILNVKVRSASSLLKKDIFGLR